MHFVDELVLCLMFLIKYDFSGDKCYRRNPHHFREYAHPHLESMHIEPKEPGILKEQFKILKDLNLLSNEVPRIPSTSEEKQDVKVPSARAIPKEPLKEAHKMHPLIRKFQNRRPWNTFFTKVKDVASTHKDSSSIFLTDLLHSCHGNLKSTVQINFLVDYDWLRMSYEATGNEKIPLLILYGEDRPDLKNIKEENVNAVRIRSPYPYGTHHTKLMILVYDDDSVRIVVSTANLVPSDWENRTQALWVSPKCPKSSNPSDSQTNFKSALLRYLKAYQVSQLHSYISTIERTDMSEVNAFFVSSSPGSHEGAALCHYGHMAAGAILRKHAKLCNWTLVVQCSSIGSLGQTPTAWAMGELSDSLAPNHKDVQVVYPSKKNVLDSIDGIFGGACLPYRRNVNVKQPWLRDYLYQWKSDRFSRTKVMPHIKTYAQVEGHKSNYVLLTSANLSKAAWGKLNKNKDKLNIMSYEAGVLLLPKFLNETKEEFFDLKKDEFVLPYDLPLEKYNDSDTPFFMDDLDECLR